MIKPSLRYIKIFFIFCIALKSSSFSCDQFDFEDSNNPLVLKNLRTIFYDIRNGLQVIPETPVHLLPFRKFLYDSVNNSIELVDIWEKESYNGKFHLEKLENIYNNLMKTQDNISIDQNWNITRIAMLNLIFLQTLNNIISLLMKALQNTEFLETKETQILRNSPHSTGILSSIIENYVP